MSERRMAGEPIGAASTLSNQPPAVAVGGHVVLEPENHPMGVLLRPYSNADADRLIELANLALPGAAAENEKWARERFAFDGRTRRRRQYVAEEDGTRLVAYAALEEGSERGRFLAFVVCSPERIDPTGDALFDRLLGDARDLSATVLWARELSRDPVLNLFRARGMRQVSRFELMGVGEVIVLEMSLSPNA